MGNRWWQHLHIALPVFAVNAGELGSHPCPVTTGFGVILLPLTQCSHCPSLRVCQQRFPAVHPSELVLGGSPADGWGLGRFCPVCRGRCFPWLCPWENSNPSGAAAAFRAWCRGAHINPPACCAATAILKVFVSMGRTHVTVPSLLIQPSVPTEGTSVFVPQPSVLNEADLFCALPPSSGACLDVKVKLQSQRIDFSEPHQGHMLITRLGIFLHISPHKHTLIKYSLEHKKCFC